AVARLQQPPAQASLDGMQGVTCGGLLNLDQQHFAIANDDPAHRFVVLGNLAKARRCNARGRPPHLNDGARVGAPRPESGKRAHRTFEADLAVSIASPWRITAKSETMPSRGK